MEMQKNVKMKKISNFILHKFPSLKLDEPNSRHISHTCGFLSLSLCVWNVGWIDRNNFLKINMGPCLYANLYAYFVSLFQVYICIVKCTHILYGLMNFYLYNHIKIENTFSIPVNFSTVFCVCVCTDTLLFQYHSLKRLSFLHWISLHLCKKSVD